MVFLVDAWAGFGPKIPQENFEGSLMLSCMISHLDVAYV